MVLQQEKWIATIIPQENWIERDMYAREIFKRNRKINRTIQKERNIDQMDTFTDTVKEILREIKEIKQNWYGSIY